jgi:hypothetical protein
MATWQEIPAHRILVLDDTELVSDFELLDEDGNVVNSEGLLSLPIFEPSEEEKKRVQEEFRKLFKSQNRFVVPIVRKMEGVTFTPVVRLIRRRSDGKLFRWAEWVPRSCAIAGQVALREA